MTIIAALDTVGTENPTELQVRVSHDAGESWEIDTAEQTETVPEWDIPADVDGSANVGAFCLVGIDWEALYLESFENIARQCSVKNRGRDYSENYSQEGYVRTFDSNANGAFSIAGMLAGIAPSYAPLRRVLGIPAGAKKAERLKLAGAFYASLSERPVARAFWENVAFTRNSLVRVWSTIAAHQNVNALRSEAKLSSISDGPQWSEDRDSEDTELPARAELQDAPASFRRSTLLVQSNAAGVQTIVPGPVLPSPLLTDADYGNVVACQMLSQIQDSESFEYAELVTRMLQPQSRQQTAEGNRKLAAIMILRAQGVDQNGIAAVTGIPVGNLPKMYQRSRKLARTIMAGIYSEIPDAIDSEITAELDAAGMLSDASESASDASDASILSGYYREALEAFTNASSSERHQIAHELVTLAAQIRANVAA